MSGRVLVSAPLPPEYDRESGSRRIYHAIEFLREAGWRVTFVCQQAGQGRRHLEHLRRLGVPTFVGFGEATRTMIERGGFDVALLAFWHLAREQAPLIRELSPSTRIVIDSIDLHWLRRARASLGAAGGPARNGSGDYGRELVEEMTTYAAADGVLTVSRREAELVDDMVCRTGFARAVPDSDDVPASPFDRQDRHGILFVGNFRHPPNLDAVEWLCGDVLPRLDAQVRARHPVSIVGTGLDGGVRSATRSCPDVRLVGWVPSLTPYFHSARISVVPLRYGAGTKRKLIQALLAGTPTVSTTVGVEGLDVVHDRHVLVADDPGDFANAIGHLLEDEDSWSRLASSGRRRMLRLRSRKAARDALLAALEDIRLAPATGLREPPSRNGDTPLELPDVPTRAIRRAVEATVPGDARVLVVSKGDPRLLELGIPRAGHFPATGSGDWCGYHPRDSAQAIEWLEASRDATHLLLPESSFWWLDYYGELAGHLAARHERIWCDGSCVIYRLARA